MTLNEYLTGISDAIREKEGSTEPIPAPDHAARILAIQTGVTLPELTNPATEEQVLSGYEFIDGEGVKKTGTYVASTGGAGLVEVTMIVPAGAYEYFGYIDENGDYQRILASSSTTDVVVTTKVLGGAVNVYSSVGYKATGDYVELAAYTSGLYVVLFKTDGGTVTPLD